LTDFKYKTKPYQHQKEALEQSYMERNFAYFMEMGCGKSKVLIDNIAWLYEKAEIDCAVIVAPKGVYMNWKNSEIPIHLHDSIRHKVYTWKSSLTKRETETLRESVVERHRLRIILVNVEAFATKKVLQYLDKVTHRSEFLLAIDESTTIKNIKAKRTKALIKFGEAAKYKRILTGAPITKSPLDLYAQFLFLDKEIMGFDSYWSFQGRYAVVRSVKMGAHSFNQVIGYRNLEEMKCKIAHYSYRTTKEEALDLPPKIYTTRQVDLTIEQERHYQSIKKTSVALLETGEMVTAPEVMTQLLRLQQLLCGYLVTDNGEVEEIPNNRMNVLMETIEEMEGKIIIWSRFRHDIIKITEKLKQTYGSDTVVNYFGDTTMQDRQDAIEKFQNLEDNVKFFISNPQTGGMGITLHAATNVIYYSNDFNLESRKQSEDRAHRVGQHHPVLYVDLMCPNTVDVHIVKTLLNKNKLASITLGERVLEWLKT
jgi:SNF2 family DNA or RNA helicase|tara:strand:+ start:2761 stop:4206 length:1446 start_codon:yes stop_codon:yes gene_type:complete